MGKQGEQRRNREGRRDARGRLIKHKHGRGGGQRRHSSASRRRSKNTRFR